MTFVLRLLQNGRLITNHGARLNLVLMVAIVSLLAFRIVPGLRVAEASDKGAIAEEGTSPRAAIGHSNHVGVGTALQGEPWPNTFSRDMFRGPMDRAKPSGDAVATDIAAEVPRLTSKELQAIADETIQLAAIFYTDDPEAILNNRIHRVGDRINDFLIISIDRRRVVLEQDGLRVYLGM